MQSKNPKDSNVLKKSPSFECDPEGVEYKNPLI